MYAILDIGTTGKNLLSDKIVHIAIIVHDGQQIRERFFSLVDPELKIPPYFFKKRHLRETDPTLAPQFYKVAREIVLLLEGKIIVTYDARIQLAILKKEFRSFGYLFHCQQVCLLRLSHQCLPGAAFRNLEASCQMEISQSEKRVPAMKKACEILMVFLELRKQVGSKKFLALLEGGQLENNLPLAIAREQVDGLPQKTGVYFFYGAQKDLLYVGKSVNIRRRVQGHFINDLKSERSLQIKQRIHEIDYTLTGSELIALLLESELIKRYQPFYNRDQKNVAYHYRIVQWINEKGYLALGIERNVGKTSGHTVITFAGKAEGESFLRRLANRFDLCQKLCRLDKRRGTACFYFHLKKCQGACIEKEKPRHYNRRVQNALEQCYYAFPDFMVVGDGRKNGERSLVLVEKGVYQGFGYYTANSITRIKKIAASDLLLKRHYQKQFQKIRERLIVGTDNPDVRRIIRRYLESSSQDTVIKLVSD